MTENVTETAPDGVPEQESKQKSKARSFWLDLLETVLLAVVLFLALNTLTSRVRVYNISMQPTLQQGYLLVVNKLAYKLGEPKHGDVIVFHFQDQEHEDYIKRVIGLPGDNVEISGGVVRVNGHPLTEPYIAELPKYAGTWDVPEDSLFVLGDNRNQSSDSHQWGFVDLDWVVGKAVVIYWPLSEVGLLTGPDLVQAAP